jgi:anthranilate phosphoribosyltransferase
VRLDAGPEVAADVLEREGIAFLFAQAYHPAMRYVAPVRREIGVRTLFNVIGPLSNPAGAHRQVVGVPRRALLGLVAQALGRLGSERAAAVHGDGGLDELSLSGINYVAEWDGASVVEYTIDPKTLGFAARPTTDLAGADAAENARIVRSVLTGAKGAHRDVVLLNAGLALVIAGAAPDVKSAIAAAAKSIDSGAADAKLAALVQATAS